MKQQLTVGTTNCEIEKLNNLANMHTIYETGGDKRLHFHFHATLNNGHFFSLILASIFLLQAFAACAPPWLQLYYLLPLLSAACHCRHLPLNIQTSRETESPPSSARNLRLKLAMWVPNWRSGSTRTPSPTSSSSMDAARLLAELLAGRWVWHLNLCLFVALEI